MSNYVSVYLEEVTCSKCGVVFGLTQSHISQLRESHDTFHCPNGHSRYYPGESEKEKLQRKLESTEKSLTVARNMSDFHERSASAQKGAKTRILNRIKEGVCPHCNRQFKNLHRHMESKHKEGE
ncbi:MAG: hypothetical protein KAS32_22370 [Candidatus Peribacteraceae bacterium]|nr:hypothetical protein [Candidatus Peribacteraceae bacterium]